MKFDFTKNKSFLITGGTGSLKKGNGAVFV